MHGPDIERHLLAQTSTVADALKNSDGKPVAMPFDESDVGGQLMQIISIGLYPDSRDALRELSQNAFDGAADNVWITLDGFSVTVKDDGSGMELPGVLRARQFGMSSKDPQKNVGFQGIGLYSGFNVCDEMRLVTRAANTELQYTLRFDFASMRDVLRTQGTSRVSLSYLMKHHTEISFERVTATLKGETMVYLDKISDTAYHELSDWLFLEQYLASRLPVSFDPAFKHVEYLEKALREKMPEYRTFDVHVENKDSGDKKTLHRHFPPGNFVKPDVWDVTLPNADGTTRVAAVAWASWDKNRKIEHDGSGIFFKVRGFTIGDRDLGRRMFQRPLYDWFIGDIFVLEPLEANAARTDFKATPEKHAFDSALQAQVGARLTGVAEKVSAILTAKKRFAEIEARKAELEAEISRLTSTDASTRLRDLHRDIELLGKQKVDALADLKDLAIRKPALQSELETLEKRLLGVINKTSVPAVQSGKATSESATASSASSTSSAATEARGVKATASSSRSVVDIFSRSKLKRLSAKQVMDRVDAALAVATPGTRGELLSILSEQIIG